MVWDFLEDGRFGQGSMFLVQNTQKNPPQTVKKTTKPPKTKAMPFMSVVLQKAMNWYGIVVLTGNKAGYEVGFCGSMDKSGYALRLTRPTGLT